MIRNINNCINNSESFAFEQYEIIIYYLRVPTIEFSIERVKLRVSQGGHNIPEQDIRRRFERSWINFQQIYKPLADSWIIFDTSANQPLIIDESEN